jgi:hypothetical protein
MEYLSFGKIAIKPDQIEAFTLEAKSKGLSVKHVQANIYEFGLQLPSMLDENTMRKTAGMIGLKYSAD